MAITMVCFEDSMLVFCVVNELCSYAQYRYTCPVYSLESVPDEHKFAFTEVETAMNLDCAVKLNNLAVVLLCNQETKKAIKALRSALSLVQNSDNDKKENSMQKYPPIAGTAFFYTCSGDSTILDSSDGVFVFGRPLFLYTPEEKKILEQHDQDTSASWLHCGAVLLFNMALACQLESNRFTNDLCLTKAGILYDATIELIHKMDCLDVSTQLLTAMTFNNRSIIYYEKSLVAEAQRCMHVVAALRLHTQVLYANFEASEISGLALNLILLRSDFSHAASAA